MLSLHEVTSQEFEIGEFRITSDFICHLDPTLGYRIQTSGASLAYLPDHEPALGVPAFPDSPEWTSGFGLAREVDLLIHDAQYTSEEYAVRVGYGHSSVEHAFQFAAMAGVKQVVPFHHDPNHSDDQIDELLARTEVAAPPGCRVVPGIEGDSIRLH
jgi:phosphoribosyl 1,2-cyclic phosphodiesterase